MFYNFRSLYRLWCLIVGPLLGGMVDCWVGTHLLLVVESTALILVYIIAIPESWLCVHAHRCCLSMRKFALSVSCFDIYECSGHAFRFTTCMQQTDRTHKVGYGMLLFRGRRLDKLKDPG